MARRSFCEVELVPFRDDIIEFRPEGLHLKLDFDNLTREYDYLLE